jgi:hypothetical protein
MQCDISLNNSITGYSLVKKNCFDKRERYFKPHSEQ